MPFVLSRDRENLVLKSLEARIRRQSHFYLSRYYIISSKVERVNDISIFRIFPPTRFNRVYTIRKKSRSWRRISSEGLLCRRDIDTYSRNSVILNEEGSYIHPIDKRFARGKDLFFLPTGERDGLLQCEALRKCRGGRKVTFLVVSNKFRTIKES